MSFTNYALGGCAALLMTATQAIAQFDSTALARMRATPRRALEQKINFKIAAEKMTADPIPFFDVPPPWLSRNDAVHSFECDMTDQGHATVLVQSQTITIPPDPNRDKPVFYGMSREEIYVDLNDNGIFEQRECTRKMVSFDRIEAYGDLVVTPRQCVTLLPSKALLVKQTNNKDTQSAFQFKENCTDTGQIFETISNAMVEFYSNHPKDAVTGVKNAPYLAAHQSCLTPHISMEGF